MNTSEANFYMGGTQVVGIYLGSTPIWTGGGGEEEEQSCEDQGLCEDGEGNCVECEDCGGDPECECMASMGIWDSENQECHTCSEVWEDLGYSSEQDCLCQEFGECSEEEEPEE